MQDSSLVTKKQCWSETEDIEQALYVSWIWLLEACGEPYCAASSPAYRLELSGKSNKLEHASSSLPAVYYVKGDNVVGVISKANCLNGGFAVSDAITGGQTPDIFQDMNSTSAQVSGDKITQTVILGLIYGVLVYSQLDDDVSSVRKPVRGKHFSASVSNGEFSDVSATSCCSTNYDTCASTLQPQVSQHSTTSSYVSSNNSLLQSSLSGVPPDIVYVSPPSVKSEKLKAYSIYVNECQPRLVLLKCLTGCVLEQWDKPKRVEMFFTMLLRALNFLAATLDSMECEKQERLVGDIFPWLVFWTGVVHTLCVASPLDGPLEMLLLKFLCVLRSSTFTPDSSRLRPIHRFCKVLLSNSVCPVDNDITVDRRFVLRWLATGRSVQLVEGEEEQPTACLGCFSEKYPYSAFCTRSPLEHNFCSGASLRPFLVAAIFLKALCWVTVDALSARDLFYSAAIVQETGDYPADQSEGTLESGGGDSNEGVATRQAAVEVLVNLWTYGTRAGVSEITPSEVRVEEKSDSGFDDLYLFRCAICLLLGRKFVSHVTDIGLVSEFQSLLSYLASPCPLEWCRLLDEACGTSISAAFLPRRNENHNIERHPAAFEDGEHHEKKTKVKKKNGVASRLLSCRAFYILQWLRRSMQCVLPSGPLVASQTHIQRTTGLSFMKESFKSFHSEQSFAEILSPIPKSTPGSPTPSVLSFLMSIPTGLELIALLLDPVTLRQTAFLALEVSPDMVKQCFQWYIVSDGDVSTIRRETFARFPTMISVIMNLARVPSPPSSTTFLQQNSAHLFTSDSAPDNSHRTLSKPASEQRNMSDGFQWSSKSVHQKNKSCFSFDVPSFGTQDDCETETAITEEKMASHLRDFPRGMTFSELARQLVMAAVFYHTPPSHMLIARIWRTIIEDWCFDNFSCLFNFYPNSSVNVCDSSTTSSGTDIIHCNKRPRKVSITTSLQNVSSSDGTQNDSVSDNAFRSVEHHGASDAHLSCSTDNVESSSNVDATAKDPADAAVLFSSDATEHPLCSPVPVVSVTGPSASRLNTTLGSQNDDVLEDAAKREKQSVEQASISTDDGAVDLKTNNALLCSHKETNELPLIQKPPKNAYDCDAAHFQFQGTQLPEWALRRVLLLICPLGWLRTTQLPFFKEYRPSVMGEWLWDFLFHGMSWRESDRQTPFHLQRTSASCCVGSATADRASGKTSSTEFFTASSSRMRNVALGDEGADCVSDSSMKLAHAATGANVSAPGFRSCPAKKHRRIFPLTNQQGLTLVHPLGTSLLRFLSFFLENWTRELGPALLASTCLGFIQFSLYQLHQDCYDISQPHSSCSSTLPISPMLLSFHDLDMLDRWNAALVNCNTAGARRCLDATLRHLVTPKLTSYYILLCRKTLVGRLLVMSGIEPQTLLRREQASPNLTYVRTKLHHDAKLCSSEKNASTVLFPLVARDIIENDLQLYDPPFLDRQFPVADVLLHVIAEAFQVLFFRVPRLWAGTAPDRENSCC